MFQTVLKFLHKLLKATTGKIISKFTYDASNVAYSLGNIITIIVKDTLLVLGLLSYLFFRLETNSDYIFNDSTNCLCCEIL